MALTRLFLCSTGCHCILLVFVWVVLYLYLAGRQLLLVPHELPHRACLLIHLALLIGL